ncbi:hypothetical protein ANN_26590 [Periplaneta americana]|uniref:Uncharacterized protein n=1 Tax=Periplaneta americana TaxID=6978 RepID=A0ABQ8RYH5_PERAM|nr:hypothetical protein ANN_26590 [Periplaneta americana]
MRRFRKTKSLDACLPIRSCARERVRFPLKLITFWGFFRSFLQSMNTLPMKYISEWKSEFCLKVDIPPFSPGLFNSYSQSFPNIEMIRQRIQDGYRLNRRTLYILKDYGSLHQNDCSLAFKLKAAILSTSCNAYNLRYNELNLYSNFHRNPLSHYRVKRTNYFSKIENYQKNFGYRFIISIDTVHPPAITVLSYSNEAWTVRLQDDQRHFYEELLAIVFDHKRNTDNVDELEITPNVCNNTDKTVFSMDKEWSVPDYLERSFTTHHEGIVICVFNDIAKACRNDDVSLISSSPLGHCPSTCPCFTRYLDDGSGLCKVLPGKNLFRPSSAIHLFDMFVPLKSILLNKINYRIHFEFLQYVHIFTVFQQRASRCSSHEPHFSCRQPLLTSFLIVHASLPFLDSRLDDKSFKNNFPILFCNFFPK